MSLKFTAVSLGECVSISGLSESNLAVGKRWTFNPRGSTASSERALVYSDGVLTGINVGPCFNSQATGVGAGNVIVGTGTNPNMFGVFGWVEENGVVTRLEGLGGSNVMPAATNGKVHAGSANLPSRVGRAVKWENGQCVDLGTVGGPASTGSAINNNGSVTGASRARTQNMQMVAFLHKDGKMTALPGLTENLSSWGYGINDNDEVVGMSQGPSGNTAVKWVKGKPVSLCGGSAFDINNNGFVVGCAGNPGFAFLHDGTSLYNLNDITEGLDGVVLQSANRINEQGCVAAVGFDKSARLRGYLLIPV